MSELDDLLYIAALGSRALINERDALRADVESTRIDANNCRLELTAERQKSADLSTRREQLVRENGTLREAVDDAQESARNASMALAYTENGLAAYITELEGFRDTAKTKAERIALGHVCERLRSIGLQLDAGKGRAF